MSNWSVVIVSWPTTDRGVDPEQHFDPDRLCHHSRLQDVARSYSAISGQPFQGKISDPNLGWCVAPGEAQEFVAVGNQTSFAPNNFAKALGNFGWEYPEHVSFMWKDEEMKTWGLGRLKR